LAQLQADPVTICKRFVARALIRREISTPFLGTIVIDCVAALKTAFVSLSHNPILIYSQEINDNNLATLKIKFATVYEAIREKRHRQALVLTGLFDARDDDIQLKFSREATSRRSYDSMIRFRDAFIGNQYFVTRGLEAPKEDWKFKEEEVDTSSLDKLSHAGRFIEALILLLARCADGKPAWRIIADSWDNPVISLTTIA
jgi:hypothetical protein